MDPHDRTVLQTEIVKLRVKAYKNIEVMGLLTAADDAFKVRDWTKAQKLFNEAKEAFSPPQPLVDIIVASKRAKSKAEARRIIATGVISIDGVKATLPTALVPKGAEVTFKGVALHE